MTITPREKEILRALLAGQKNTVTAGELGVTVRTVYRHTASIRRKLKASSTLQAVVLLIRRGVSF